ncbi:unnamed protein product, partial [Staurois parvus]
MIECEEFVPPVPPPPYYPPEYTCSSETDAQSITYNGSMDSPIPLYPTDFPPSYESVMGLREDSQATLYDAQAHQNSMHSASDRRDSTGHSGNEDSSPSEDSVLLDVQGSVRSVDYVLYRSIQRSRADYCLSVDCGQCGHHQHSPTLSLQGPFEEVSAPQMKGGRSFSCSTPSSCQDPPPTVGSGTTRSCNRLENIGTLVGPCFPELRVNGKVPRARELSRSSGCSLHHSSPCQTPDCPHRRYSENTRPKALCTNQVPRFVVRSHSDPGISSIIQTDFGDVDYMKVLEEDNLSLSSIDAAALCAEAGPHRHHRPTSPLLLRTGSAGKEPLPGDTQDGPAAFQKWCLVPRRPEGREEHPDDHGPVPEPIPEEPKGGRRQHKAAPEESAAPGPGAVAPQDPHAELRRPQLHLISPPSPVRRSAREPASTQPERGAKREFGV